jgi:hypothetical protein
MIKETLQKVKNVQADFCVSILLETHRTHPENKKDGILLKNLIDEARDRLLKKYEPSGIKNTFKQLEQLEKDLDHQYNLDGMAIFANEHLCEFARLPIKVDSRVIIDINFATRDLVRAQSQAYNYFILTLSEKEGHLYEAFRDKVVREIEAFGFPFENDLYTTDPLKNSMGRTEDRYSAEFFNRVDKGVHEAYLQNPLKLVVVGVERNHSYFRKVTDHEALIIGELNGNFDDGPLPELGQQSWHIVEEYIKEQKEKNRQLLSQGESQKKLVSGLGEIWNLVNQGRGDTFFVEENFFQPAKLDGMQVELMDKTSGTDVVDDLIDEIIEVQLTMKGNVVFLPDGELDQYEKAALYLRY